jgi:hypothetical protein
MAERSLPCYDSIGWSAKTRESISSTRSKGIMAADRYTTPYTRKVDITSSTSIVE